MRILVFSDTHLTKRFGERKFNFLSKIIKESDRVIIAGDFWEGKLINFDEFVTSEWSRLFPLLKKKHTVYVYGNHDRKKYSDKRVNLFSEKQTERYTFFQKDMVFIVEHGDSFNLKYTAIKKIVSYTRMSKRFFFQHLHEDLEHILVTIFGSKILQIMFKRYNKRIKRSVKNTMKKNEFIICGHTHAAEIDLKNHFINTGIIRHGLGQYVTIENGKIKLHEERY